MNVKEKKMTDVKLKLMYLHMANRNSCVTSGKRGENETCGKGGKIRMRQVTSGFEFTPDWLKGKKLFGLICSETVSEQTCCQTNASK